MSAQRQELVPQPQYSLAPRNFEELERLANLMANSSICPESMRGRPGDVLMIIQMGNELNLGPAQAIKTIGCINGIPFAWGDGLHALARRHPDYVEINEWTEGDINKGNAVAFCTLTRKGQQPQTRSFSMEDARRAGLLTKKGPWQQYTKRMLLHRARTYCIRDLFPDAILGLKSEEEAKNLTTVHELPKVTSKGLDGLRETLSIQNQSQQEEISDAEIIQIPEETLVEMIEEEIDISEPEIEDPVRAQFFALILDKNVPEKAQKKWCDQAKVECLNDLPIEAMQKIINHYRNKKEK